MELSWIECEILEKIATAGIPVGYFVTARDQEAEVDQWYEICQDEDVIYLQYSGTYTYTGSVVDYDLIEDIDFTEYSFLKEKPPHYEVF